MVAAVRQRRSLPGQLQDDLFTPWKYFPGKLDGYDGHTVFFSSVHLRAKSCYLNQCHLESEFLAWFRLWLFSGRKHGPGAPGNH
jgi:hypothetical protein